MTNVLSVPVILRDVTYTVMAELLQFMYQGVVNVKHTDLSSFMKIAQALQIKGLATSAQKSPSSPIQSNNSISSKANSGNSSAENYPSNNVIETKINSALFANKPDGLPSSSSSTTPISLKRCAGSSTGVGGGGGPDYGGPEQLSIFPKKQMRRTSESGDHDNIANESMENMSSDEVFLPPIPQISMSESRFDLNNVKRETTEPLLSPGAMRNLVPPPFNFEYNNSGYNKNIEYPNDLHIGSDYGKTSALNHMDIPAGNSIVYLIFINSQLYI